MSAEQDVRYTVVHNTQYDYSEAVTIAHHVARLTPRDLVHQKCLEHRIDVEPAAAVVKTHQDYFGNAMTFFAMQTPHKRLTVRARSEVAMRPVSLPPWSETCAWERAADRAKLPLDALECALELRSSRANAETTAYTRSSFPPGRPLLEAVGDLTARIHRDFVYDPTATTIATSLAEVFAARRGVCQDFARLEVACLRAMGVPARYVSGYLETVPVPGKTRLVGADASHAWVGVYCPDGGWMDVDPTNNLLPANRHVTLAWGRDYVDVSPTRGVILGGGTHTLKVNVDVARA